MQQISSKAKDYTVRFVLYCVGLFVLGCGINMCIASNLGSTSISTLPYVISEVWQLDLGLCSTAVLSAIVGIQALVLRRDFQPVMLLQLFSSSVYGVFVGLANRLLMYVPQAPNYVVQVGYCLLGIVLVALGVLIYLGQNLVSLPVEGLAQTLAKKYHKQLPDMKMCIDWTIVISAVIVSYCNTGTVIGVREGTLLGAFGVGYCMKLMLRAKAKWMANRAARV